MSDDLSMMFSGVSKDYPVVLYGNEVLRQPTASVRKIDSEIRLLVSRMRTIMTDANGIGLAGPQVGVSKSVIVYMDFMQGDEPVVKALVNPEIVKCSEETEPFDEGCLSMPELRATVIRPSEVWVKGMDMTGRTIRVKAHGLTARVLQHEIDHLSGKLFIDIADPNSFYWLGDEAEPEEEQEQEQAAVL
ncbi:MAG: peptide deformylase [Armatimonadota bacterium]